MIITKSIHISWSQILTSEVSLSLFVYELLVYELLVFEENTEVRLLKVHTRYADKIKTQTQKLYEEI